MTGTSSAVRRVSSLVLAVVFFLSALTFLIPGKADQLPPTQSLKVYAQYYADPSTVTLLKEFSRAEMNDLSYSDIGDELYYCNVTRYKTLMRVHARGVILKDFLSDVVGVDLNSVRALHFHTSDVDADARFLSKGRQELLDDVRWYYPNLNDNAHYDRETDEFVIEDDVEIGANTCIDRATMGSTIIHKGVKLDNLCQIAHNVAIGSNTVMASQSGCAGSGKVGNNCVIAGQVGIVGHITVGDRVTIAAQSGVTRNVASDSVILGSPAMPADKQKKIFVLQRKLEEMYNEINELKKNLK